MADGIELNCRENEITEVPENQLLYFSDALKEVVQRSVHSVLTGETSVPRELPPDFGWRSQIMPEVPENEQVVLKVGNESWKNLFRWKSLFEPEVPENEQVVLKVGNKSWKNLFRRSFRGRKYTKFSKQNSKGTWSDQSLALLITVMGVFAGAAYMVLFSFHEAFPISAAFKGLVNLSVLELLTFPRAATDDFLVITTVTTTFILSMGMNTIAVCIFFRKFVRRTFLTILSLFTMAAFSLSFFAMLSKFVPHRITIAGGNLKIPATFIVIFYDIYAILLVCAIAYTVHWCWSCMCNQDAVVEPESEV